MGVGTGILVSGLCLIRRIGPGATGERASYPGLLGIGVLGAGIDGARWESTGTGVEMLEKTGDATSYDGTSG